ncbi:ABC transporter permease [Micromonospora sp. WMMD1102]|uniref:ABC transporter permease n=1 Tax=Micromonospora sp. WMMD1102 TaxID=3016105 RepID=UPI0024156869|nr:ABC transporter permease [Micromonospora sp. WMMD1102]MDG4790005.1 ABC transporter permease [Micromonospora sp. WMMD1102]
MTAPASAFPRTVDDLMPEARKVPVRDGELVPSQRRLMSVLSVGQEKAKEIRARLIEEGVQRDFGAAPVGNPDTDDTEPEPIPERKPATLPAEPVAETTKQARVDEDTDDTAAPVNGKPVVVWPVWVMLAPAFVSVWAGWVGLGERTGYGVMNLLPGFTNDDGKPLLSINTAITLPIGMEVYAAYALYVCLSGRVPPRARKFAGWSAAISLIVGAAGQVTYHLLVESNLPTTPWGVTMAVSCIPVAVLGMGAALAHLVRSSSPPSSHPQ